MRQRVAGVVTYLLFATLVTLIFYVAVPGPDGYGAPLIVSVCRPQYFGGWIGGVGNGPLGGLCESSLVALIVDVILVAVIFLVLARVGGRTAGTASAFGALLAVLLLAYLAAGTESGRLVAWAGCLAVGVLFGVAFSWLPGRRSRTRRAA